MSTKEKGNVSPQNQIPIDKDKLKEEEKAELKAATDLMSSGAFCLTAPTGVER